MFDGTVTWTSVDTSVSAYSMNDTTSPMNDFEPTLNTRTDTTRDKPMTPGKWRTRSQLGNYTIHAEGTLFADTSADYITARKALVLALFGTPDRFVTEDYMGTLAVTPEGETEAWEIDCVVTMFSAPIKGNYPALTDYLVTFESFDPWFIGATSGNKYIW